MTPEERFERIETQLELLARYGAATANRLDSLADRVEGLAEAQRHISRDVAKLVDAVASLVKLFERHVGDGHGGKE
jgi:ABC-type transporter Mla subunit MlaD